MSALYYVPISWTDRDLAVFRSSGLLPLNALQIPAHQIVLPFVMVRTEDDSCVTIQDLAHLSQMQPQLVLFDEGTVSCQGSSWLIPSEHLGIRSSQMESLLHFREQRRHRLPLQQLVLGNLGQYAVDAATVVSKFAAVLQCSPTGRICDDSRLSIQESKYRLQYSAMLRRWMSRFEDRKFNDVQVRRALHAQAILEDLREKQRSERAAKEAAKEAERAVKRKRRQLTGDRGRLKQEQAERKSLQDYNRRLGVAHGLDAGLVPHRHTSRRSQLPGTGDVYFRSMWAEKPLISQVIGRCIPCRQDDIERQGLHYATRRGEDLRVCDNCNTRMAAGEEVRCRQPLWLDPHIDLSLRGDLDSELIRRTWEAMKVDFTRSTWPHPSEPRYEAWFHTAFTEEFNRQEVALVADIDDLASSFLLDRDQGHPIRNSDRARAAFEYIIWQNDP